ncbi:hypothetical protein Ddc_01659 [Ditylenchus destructor]|nr:hypothetical protein Ddc_01659 [Ditylenchus destructor]
MYNKFVACLVSVGFVALAAAQWPRWEERTLDCTSSGRRDQCILIARNAKVQRDPVKYKCRREPMPQHSWNTLARESTRLACPIGCEPDADLSVIQKRPIDNKLCQKYYTYGKYRDQKEGEWYMWLTEPCIANLTTHCRFNDVPFYPGDVNPPQLEESNSAGNGPPFTN